MKKKIVKKGGFATTVETYSSAHVNAKCSVGKCKTSKELCGTLCVEFLLLLAHVSGERRRLSCRGGSMGWLTPPSDLDMTDETDPTNDDDPSSFSVYENLFFHFTNLNSFFKSIQQLKYRIIILHWYIKDYINMDKDLYRRITWNTDF